MQTELPNGQEAVASPEAKKMERKAAMAEIKRLYPHDPVKAREAAALWFEQHAAPVTADAAEMDSFHRRKLKEEDPERHAKAAESLRKSEAGVEHAQKAAAGAVKEWRKKNPNKVKKLNKLYREQQKPTPRPKEKTTQRPKGHK